MDTPINISEEITTVTIGEQITSVSIEETTTVIETENQWPPGPPWVDWLWSNPWDFAYPHSQSIASSEWDIIHNLGFNPNVQIMDSAWDLVMPMKIIHDSVNRTRIQFLWSMSGQAYLS